MHIDRNSHMDLYSYRDFREFDVKLIYRQVMNINEENDVHEFEKE
jgi:hypothetical protein